MIQQSTRQIEKILSVLTLCLIPVHLVGSWINSINSIDKGYGHTYPLETYALIGFYLLVVVAADLYILFRQQFVHLKGYLFYWGISSIIVFLSLLGLMIFDTYTIGPIIVVPLLATPYGILFPLAELFFIENSPTYYCFLILLFCLLNWGLCKFVKHLSNKKSVDIS